MNSQKSRQQKVVILTIAAFVLLALLLIVLDWKEVSQIIGKGKLEFVILSLAFTVMSYICQSYGYVIVNRAFEVKIGRRELFEVGLVSSALNNILAFLGAAGHSLRLAVIQKQGTAAGTILAASIFHSYLNNLIMTLLLVIGLFNLVFSHLIVGGGIISLGVSIGITVFFLFIATGILLKSGLRLRLLRLLITIARFITHRDITSFVNDFNNAMTVGISLLKRKGRALTLLLGLMIMDWIFAAVALWFCFYALGEAPRLGELLSGFGIGISVGNISFVPGGLGIQEASMAGTFALLGVSFSLAALAAILFRVIYDFVPFLLTLGLYRQLLKSKSQNRV